MMEKWKFVQEWHGEFESVSGMEDSEKSQKFEGNSKGFKNCLIFVKHVIFATETSRKKVSRASRQNT